VLTVRNKKNQKQINKIMKLRELVTTTEIEEDASAGATSAGAIASVATPLFVRGKTRRAKRKNARAAVGLKPDRLSGIVGRGVFEGSVIYRVDRDNPMDESEILVLGGAGRYSFRGLREKARKEAAELARNLDETDSGQTFRTGAHNVKQLTNTLNTIVAAYNEFNEIRKKGGRGSRGIRNEDREILANGIALLETAAQRNIKEAPVRQSDPVKVMNNIVQSNRAWPVKLADGTMVTVTPDVAKKFLKIVDASDDDAMFKTMLQKILRGPELFKQAVANIKDNKPLSYGVTD
jgi:hypothetical protein